MITARRSQEFHELVEGTTTGGDPASTYAPLMEVVGALRAVPVPVADPAFVARLREQLLAEAATVLIPAASSDTDERLRLHPVSPHVRRRNRRLAGAVSGLALVGAAAAMSYVAQSSLPGDGLYPLKRGIESAHAELTLNRAGQGRVVLGSASTRLDEIAQLSREGADPARVADTLDAFTSEAISGSDLLVSDFQTTGDDASITTVRTFTATSMTRLHDLQGSIPQGSSDQLLQAAQALEQIQEVSVHSCASCSGPLVSQAPNVLTDRQVSASAPLLGGVRTGHQGGNDQGGQLPNSPQLPHLTGPLPPASITDPTTVGGTDGTDGTTGMATLTDVKHTIDSLTNNLTTNLTTGTQATTNGVSDSAANLLDSVSQTGITIGTTVGGVISQVTGLLPTGLPTNVPTDLPTNLPTSVPTSLPTDPPSDLPSLP